MSHIDVRRIIDGENQYAGRNWIYDYREAFDLCPENEFEKWHQKKHQQISNLTSNWDDLKHSEWLTRNFLSAKMIMGATLHLNSLDFAQEKNLRVVKPYLEYYSVLHAMRALVLSMPSQNWQSEALLNQNHKAIINTTCNCISEFSKEKADVFHSAITWLKASRELVSYRAPSSGHDSNKESVDVIYICTVLCEIAQIFSELLEKSLAKNYEKGNQYSIKLEDFSVLYNPSIDGISFPDSEDKYRINYLVRKHPFPTNLSHIISEGHSEDFFGAWHCDEIDNDESLFNPDTDWQLIFDIP